RYRAAMAAADDAVDSGIGQQRHVEAGGFLGLLVEPEAGRDSVWHGVRSSTVGSGHRLGGRLAELVLRHGLVTLRRRYRPAMAEGILEEAVAVAPEHVGDRHPDRGAGGDRLPGNGVDVRHGEVDGDRRT